MDAPFQPAGDDLLALRDAARDVARNAYVPYSHFHVGAALHYTDGSVVVGCNVENASYGLTVCAERSALVRSIAEGRDPKDIDLVAVHVDGDEGQPCGMCRQFLVELVPQARIAFVSGGIYVEAAVPQLLPSAFVPEALDR
jgi:cytidine deaminase